MPPSLLIWLPGYLPEGDPTTKIHKLSAWSCRCEPLGTSHEIWTDNWWARNTLHVPITGHTTTHPLWSFRRWTQCSTWCKIQEPRGNVRQHEGACCTSREMYKLGLSVFKVWQKSIYTWIKSPAEREWDLWITCAQWIVHAPLLGVCSRRQAGIFLLLSGRETAPQIFRVAVSNPALGGHVSTLAISRALLSGCVRLFQGMFFP